MAALSEINRALNQVPKRAEKQELNLLHETFVDSGVADVLDSMDHQVLYGRRGTGKTHALSYLGSEVESRGDVALNIDLRTIGSPDGLLNPEAAPALDRAARLLVDLLGQFHDSLLNAVLRDEALIDDGNFVAKADELLATITSIRVSGDVELVSEAEAKRAEKASAGIKANVSKDPSVEANLGREAGSDARSLLRETRRGAERISLNFSDVARALRDLAATLVSRRVWLLLDEWSSVPRDLQPYLAEFLLRCVLPLRKFTVKIAAIEQQTNFRAEIGGRLVGIELGADMGAHVNLDDFLVYEGNEEQARNFFMGLFHKHLMSSSDSNSATVPGMQSPSDVVRLGFTDIRAFDELVRAAEGVPRDALYIAAKAGSRAGIERISVPLVRAAARGWYLTDKSRPLESREEAQRLLNWIIDKVIREKRARAFLVNGTDSRNPLLLALFDARVLHIVRRGYSAQDQPGERFDVWGIDYGAYVDLLQTKNAPLSALPVGDGSEDDVAEYVGTAVPKQDLRAIRRAILNLGEFDASGGRN